MRQPSSAPERARLTNSVHSLPIGSKMRAAQLPPTSNTLSVSDYMPPINFLIPVTLERGLKMFILSWRVLYTPPLEQQGGESQKACCGPTTKHSCRFAPLVTCASQPDASTRGTEAVPCLAEQLRCSAEEGGA